MSKDGTHEAHDDGAPRISIAMATYNGGKYILEQLNSISQQNTLPFELIICDDGSSDDTHDIINKFCETAPFPVRFIKNEVNLGYANNFLKAAKLCKGDWISFCDQDDVWLPNKLSNTIKAIQMNKNAILILQNAILSDTELKIRGRLFPNAIKAGVYGAARQRGHWVWFGFLQTCLADIIREINSTDRPIMRAPDMMYSHDQWTCMIANAIGDIVVLDEPVALYRRHPSALTGEHRVKNIKEYISNALSTSSTHYESQAKAAISAARYAKDMAESCKNSAWQDRLSKAADDFEKIAKIQTLRANIYAERNIFLRLKYVQKIFVAGGYFGSPMIALSAMSAVKDLAAAFGLVDQLKRKNRKTPSDPD